MTRSAQPLVVIGTGGFGRETGQLLRAHPACGVGGRHYRVIGFLDDDPQRHGTHVDGHPVLGSSEQAGQHVAQGTAVLVCVGSPRSRTFRRDLVRRIGLPDEATATLVHPLASVSPDSAVGPGSVLQAGVVLTAGVQVGRHVAVMPQAVLSHDDLVADHVSIAAGVRLAGEVVVGEAAYLGAGAVVRENCHIGAAALVGMGSVVLRDVPPGEDWAGVPARRLGPPASCPEDPSTVLEDRS